MTCHDVVNLIQRGTTLTYNPNLAKVNADLHIKKQGRRSNYSAMGDRPERRANATKCIISLLAKLCSR